MSDFAHHLVESTGDDKIIPILPLKQSDIGSLTGTEQAWAAASLFDGAADSYALIPDKEGGLSKVLVGTGEENPDPSDCWWLAGVADKLPQGTYSLDPSLSIEIQTAAALGWCLAHYRFDRYKKKPDEKVARILSLPEGAGAASIVRQANTMAFVRDLINTPTEDMGPADLQDAAEGLAEAFGGTCSTIVGDDLLDENFPAIHTVGRAAASGREPRLIDLRWGDENAPKLTLVGKGVCYDTGGLDIKPGAGMRLMKKDMGGAAHALGLARFVMEAELNVNLRVLIPAVENAIAGNSYRPGDVIATRKGLSVEVGNTDAEGRIVLCDALTLACEEKPDLILDYATLTGAARVALGPDLPATYANDESLWKAIEKSANTLGDPLWRMPLWAPYDKKLHSPIADLSNISEGGFVGSITAALYLQRFIEEGINWGHFDIYAWEPNGQPGRPKGAAVQSIRASLNAIKIFLSLAD